MACRMPQNAPEAAHYKLQLVALKREVDKGKGNSMLYSAYLQVLNRRHLLPATFRLHTLLALQSLAVVARLTLVTLILHCRSLCVLPLPASCAGSGGAEQRAGLPAVVGDLDDANSQP